MPPKPARTIKRLPVLGLLLGLILAIGVASAEAAVPHAFYGVTPQTKLNPADFDQMGNGGVGTLRYEMSWNDVDPAPLSLEEIGNGNRNYSWWVFDPIVYYAARQGVRVLPTVYGTPHWVASLQGCASNCHKLGPNTPGAYVAFSQFMRAAVQRYGPDGDFWAAHPRLPYKPIRVWQIWNEQNSSDYWKPEPSVYDYANLLIAGGEAVHAVDPGAQVIPGGMIGEPAQEGKKTVSGWNFMQALYANPRARAAFNGLAVHPYGAKVSTVKRIIWRWRDELRRAGAPNDKLWVTEVGWASGGEEHPLNRGPQGQARQIGDALEFFTKRRSKYKIANVDVYAWRDAAPNAPQCTWCAHSGLLRYNSQKPKPAWRVYKSFTKR